METKRCGRCRVVQGLSSFVKDKNMKNGLSCYCKACQKVRGLQYRSNPAILEKLRVYYHKRYSENKLKAAAYSKDRYLTPKGRYSSYKCEAKTRSIHWNLSYEQFLSFWQSDCYYCGDKVSTIGLDRVNNSIGYTIDNVVSCCFFCNSAKNVNSQEVFFTKVSKIFMLHLTGVSHGHS